ncbi:MAG: hypothetical protein WDM87_11205 [Terracidiphilus sp.]
MKKMFNLFVGVILAITTIGGIILLASWGWDGLSDRKHSVIANSNVPVFVGSGDGKCNGEQRLTIIPTGTLLRVRRIRYWRNCATLDVTLPDREHGFIIPGDGNFSVRPPLP